MNDASLEKKGVPIWVQISFLFLWIGVIISLSVFGDVSSVQEETINELMTPAIIRVMIVVQAVLVFFLPIAFFIFLLRQTRFSFLTLELKPRWHEVVVGICAMIFSFPLVSWLGEVNAEMKLPASLTGLESWMKSMETQSSKTSEVLLNDKSLIGLVLNLFTIAFTAAFSEELFFRATMQKTLTETKMNYHMGIWIVAFVFSAIHMQFYGFLPRLILGAVLGYLFYFSGSIWISIIAHFANNALVVILGYFSSDQVNLNPLEKGKDEWDISFGWPLATLSLISIYGVFFYLKKISDKKKTSEEISG